MHEVRVPEELSMVGKRAVSCRGTRRPSSASLNRESSSKCSLLASDPRGIELYTPSQLPGETSRTLGKRRGLPKCLWEVALLLCSLLSENSVRHL